MLPITPHVMTVAAAEAVAAANNAGDEDGWTYKVVPYSATGAIVVVYDETGYELGPL